MLGHGATPRNGKIKIQPSASNLLVKVAHFNNEAKNATVRWLLDG